MEFLDETDWGSLLGKGLAAVVILVVTWLVAMLVKSLFTRLSTKVPALRKAGAAGATIGQTLGSIGSLLVWMLGLVALLQVLGLSAVLRPIQSLLDGVLSFLPNLIGAIVVFVVGALLAKVVRQFVETTWVPCRSRSGSSGRDRPPAASPAAPRPRRLGLRLRRPTLAGLPHPAVPVSPPPSPGPSGRSCTG